MLPGQVEAASASVSQMRRELEAREARCAELEGLNRQLRQATSALEAQLGAGRQRTRELEVRGRAGLIRHHLRRSPCACAQALRPSRHEAEASVLAADGAREASSNQKGF